MCVQHGYAISWVDQSHNIALALNFKVQVSVTYITPVYSPFSHIIRPALYRSWNILKSYPEVRVTFQVSSVVLDANVIATCDTFWCGLTRTTVANAREPSANWKLSSRERCPER